MKPWETRVRVPGCGGVHPGGAVRTGRPAPGKEEDRKGAGAPAKATPTAPHSAFRLQIEATANVMLSKGCFQAKLNENAI